MKYLLIIMIMAACVMPAGIGGCTRTLYVPASSVSDTRTATGRTDTLIVRDSVAVEPRGDTVYHTRVRTVYRTAAVCDTLIMLRTDTVPVPVGISTAGQAVSRASAWWKRFAFGVSAVAVLLLWLLQRLRRP